MQKNDTILIIGATSSIAVALARVLAKRGYVLLLAGRDENELELLCDDLTTRYGASCRVHHCDVSEPEFSALSFARRVGACDHAVIAIGDMGTNDADDAENLARTAVLNYIIPAQLASALCVRMAENKHGTLAVISSVAGDRGRASNYVYGAAKAALSTFLSGLRARYAAHGVHVMTIKPGPVDTSMTWGIKAPLIANRERVAEAIAQAMEKRKDVAYVPWFWRWIMCVIGHLPERIFKKLRF